VHPRLSHSLEAAALRLSRKPQLVNAQCLGKRVEASAQLYGGIIGDDLGRHIEIRLRSRPFWIAQLSECRKYRVQNVRMGS
jgi:hypothetical protein